MGMEILAYCEFCFEIVIDLANLSGSVKSPFLVSDIQALG